MKKSIVVVFLLAVILVVYFYFNRKGLDKSERIESATEEVHNLEQKGELRNGDLIFQVSLSGQSKAIQVATNSKYSHCGIVYREGDDFFVFEAIQPVTRTPLAKWIARGKDGKYVIKRLKNAKQVLTPEVLSRMKEIGDSFSGKNYDLTFEWSDDKIYCSELIWKIYQRSTGIEIGKLQKLADFNLSDAVVQAKLKERYGSNLPLAEIVISPVSIYESELLELVAAN